VVLLPDILLGQVVWGGARDQWPQDWRGDLLQTLRSLTDLRLEVLRLSSSEGWRPQLGMYSVAVGAVEQISLTRPQEDFCRPCCPMWGSKCVHRHLAIQAGYGFLGVLEHFATGEGAPCRTYDFKNAPEAGEELREARKAGQLVTISAPTALFGRAKWAGLADAHLGIIQGLIAEVTRPVPPARSQRADQAHVLQGNKVPGVTPRSRVACPLLGAKGRYVAFCGNGKRWGMGYLIAGNDGRGWLERCGYDVPADPGELGREIRSFLGHLREVGEVLGLIVVGLAPNGEWLDLPTLIALAHTRHGVEQLLAVHLRVYGPEDYLARCRDHFSERGHFADIPGGESGAGDNGHPQVAVGLADLSTRLRAAAIKQIELAQALGVSQPYVSQLMTSSRPWPEQARQRAEALLAERTGTSGMMAPEGEL
jgi:hypothetical protein